MMNLLKPIFSVTPILALSLVLTACGEGGFQPVNQFNPNRSLYPNGTYTQLNGQPMINGSLPSASTYSGSFVAGTGWCSNGNACMSGSINPATGRPYTCVPINPRLQASLQFSIPTFQANFNPFWYLNANNANYSQGCFARKLKCETKNVTLTQCKVKKNGKLKCKAVANVCSASDNTIATTNATTTTATTTATSATAITRSQGATCPLKKYDPKYIVTRDANGNIAVSLNQYPNVISSTPSNTAPSNTAPSNTAPVTASSSITTTKNQGQLPKQSASTDSDTNTSTTVAQDPIEITVTGDLAKQIYDSVSVKPASVQNMGDVKNGKNIVCTKNGDTVVCQYHVNVTTGEILTNGHFDETQVIPQPSADLNSTTQKPASITLTIPADLITKEHPTDNGINVKNTGTKENPVYTFGLNPKDGSVNENPDFKGASQAPTGIEDDTIPNSTQPSNTQPSNTQPSNTTLTPSSTIPSPSQVNSQDLDHTPVVNKSGKGKMGGKKGGIDRNQRAIEKQNRKIMRQQKKADQQAAKANKGKKVK